MSLIKKIQEVVRDVQASPSQKVMPFQISDDHTVLRRLTWNDLDLRHGWILFAPGAFGPVLARGTAVAAEAATVSVSATGSSFLARLGVFGVGVATGAGVAVATRSSGVESAAETSFLKRLQAAVEEWVTPTGGPLVPQASPGLVPLPSPGFPTGPIHDTPRTPNTPGRPQAPDRFAPGPDGDPSTSPAAPLPREYTADMTDLPPVMSPVASTGEKKTEEDPPEGEKVNGEDGTNPNKRPDHGGDDPSAVPKPRSGLRVVYAETEAAPPHPGEVDVGELLRKGEPVGLVLPKGGSIVVDPNDLGYQGPFMEQGPTVAPLPLPTSQTQVPAGTFQAKLGKPEGDDPNARVSVLLKIAASARKTHPGSDVFNVIARELEKLGKHRKAREVRAMGRAPYKSRADELVARLWGEFSSLVSTDTKGRELEALLAALLATLLQLKEYRGTEEARKGLRDTAVAFTSQLRNRNAALLEELQKYKGPIFEMRAIIPLLNEIASIPPPDMGHGLLHAAAENIKAQRYALAERLLEAAHTLFKSRHDTAGMAEAADMLEGLYVRLRPATEIDGSIVLGKRSDGELITLQDRWAAAEKVRGMDGRTAIETGFQMFRDLAEQTERKKEDIILLKTFLAAMSCLMPNELVTLLGKVELDASLMKQLGKLKNITLRWAGDLIARRYILAEMKQVPYPPDAVVPATVSVLQHLTAFITWTRGLIEEDRNLNLHLTPIRERSIQDTEQRIHMILRLLHHERAELNETPLDQVYDALALNPDMLRIAGIFIASLRSRDAEHSLEGLSKNLSGLENILNDMGHDGTVQLLEMTAQRIGLIVPLLMKYHPSEVETWMSRDFVSPRAIFITAFLRLAVLAGRGVPGFESPGLASVLIQVSVALSPFVEIYKKMEAARLEDLNYHLSDQEMVGKEAVEFALGGVLKHRDPKDIGPLPVLFKGSDVESLVFDLVRNPSAFVQQGKAEGGPEARPLSRLVPPLPDTPPISKTPEGTP